MKRNSALGKIWNILYLKTDLDEHGIKLLSENILDELEYLGMLPPLNENDYSYSDNYDRVTVNAARHYFTWEK